jgi:predicted Zn finger-like uncharacterized protein
MDVQCERCKTEYEFDDALVSGRGTTVRCTHCGHQFKVRRADAAGDAAGDRWVVQTSSGPQLTFLTLRELQRAILAKQVARHDLLILSDAPARPLRDITELEPFFEGRATSRPPPPVSNSGTHHPPPPPPPARRTQTVHGSPEPPAPPNASARSLPPPAFFEPSGAALHHVDHGPARSAPPPRPPERVLTAPPAAVAVAPPLVDDRPVSSLPPPTDPVRRGGFDEDLRITEDTFPSSNDETYGLPGRRRVGGWVVAFVLLVAVGVVGWVVAKPYLVAPGPAGVSPKLDGRAQQFLSQSEKAMADGDLETSQEAVDKASALAETDPRVLLDESRVAAAKADVPWLKLRLVAPDAADELRTIKAQLDELVAHAQKAADQAVAAAPDDPAAVRAKIDALRLAGDREGARSYVPKVTAIVHQPETAYVLAAIDLAEPSPFWATVIERLRLAVAGEPNAGRARAALVYALAKSGDAMGAKAELAKLDALTRPYPCSPSLHALVDQAPPKAAAERSVATSVPRTAPPQPPPRTSPPAAGAAAGDGVPGEQTSAMQAAEQAIRKGDFNRARRIYEALVVRNPGDSEALAGIGDVARAAGDTAGAIAAYKRAIAVNPSYLPALLGVADTEWASGDHATAERAYRDIADRFPEGSYPGYVKTRGESPAPAATEAPAAAPSSSAAAQPYDPGNGI